MYNTDCKHKSCYLQVIILIGIYIHKQLHIIIYLKIGTFIALEIVPLVVVGIKRLKCYRSCKPYSISHCPPHNSVSRSKDHKSCSGSFDQTYQM